MTPAELNLNREFNFVNQKADAWERFVFHIKYSSEADGVIELWKDGIKHLSLIGPNAIALNRCRIKWGLYGAIDTTEMTCYFDDVRIGGSNCSLEEISS